MLTIELPLKRTRRLKARHRWYYAKPLPADAYRLAVYYFCGRTTRAHGFKRTPKFTKLIQLGGSEDDLMQGFRKNTRYEIRRAQKEGLNFARVPELRTYTEFYNGFAASKQQPPIDAAEFERYWPAVKVTQMGAGEEPLVMHSYLLDAASGRAGLLHSASQFRGADDGQKRNLIGRANRLLHFEDMLWLKREGFTVYDFGGYAANTKDEDLARINDFKDSFGGEVIEESTFTSWALELFRRMKGLRRRAKPAT